MPEPASQIQAVGELIDDLRAIGLTPVLVGGMALVVRGSRRVTNDFDLVIAHPGDRLDPTLESLYARGLELVSRLDEGGNVVATIANRSVAGARLRLDKPSSAYFYNVATGLRVDLLFDFPIDAGALASRATKTKIRSHVFAIASDEDLLALKRIAAAARFAPGDAEDIAFLESRLRTRAGS
ncbi:MAG: hypothetical protein M3Q55_06975 [Acidobacteriota bacterium]|nr:hypothetical protein [Acidobacteriota bacterium]